jgi:hypothetical protein
MKINWSRLVFGLLFVLGGIALTVASFFASFVFLIYSLPMIAVGIWLLFNDKEDVIEQREDLNKSKGKK